jgi:hypothetical protein
MAAGIPTRLTAAQGRRFGLTVGIAFAVFAGIAWWRGHPTTATVLGIPAGLLLVAGLLIPTYLGPVERGWMKLALVISKVTTPIVMGGMYLLVLTPVGVLRRAFGGNPMAHAPGGRGYWQQRPQGQRAGNLQRQF